MKAMHRLIMLTSTYQMSTRQDDRSARLDPENRLQSHFARRRLEAEAIRDAILAVSGELDNSMGGSLLPTKNHSYVNNTGGAGSVKYDVESPLGLSPRDPQRTLRRIPGVRFRRPEHLERQANPDDGRAPGALHDERPAGPEVLATPWRGGCWPVPISTRRAASIWRFGAPTAVLRPGGRSTVPRITRVDSKTRWSRRGVAPEARPRRAWQLLCQAIFSSSEFVYLD